MKDYDQWREDNIKVVGAPIQHKSEERLDARDHMPMAEMVNEETGTAETFKEDVAQVYEGRKTHTRKKLVFSVPHFPGWDRSKVEEKKQE